MTKTDASYKAIWSLSYPIILSSLAQTILQITDTAFLGRVGEVELGASAIAGVFYFTLVMVGIGFGIGAQVLIARRAGEEQHAEIGRIFRHAAWLFLMISAVFLVIIYLMTPAFFSLIITSDEIRNAANQYILWWGWGIVFALITISFRSFYIGIASTRLITYNAFLTTAINILLDYVMIFGHYGFPEMGIAGAGLASAISETIGALYLGINTAMKTEFKPFSLFRFGKNNFGLTRQIIRLSTPATMQFLMSMGSYFIFFVFIERLSGHDLAVSNIVRSAYMVLMIPLWGFSAAANSMVSNLIGQKRQDEVMSLLKKIIFMSFSVSLTLSAFYFVFPEIVLGAITNNITLIRDSTLCLYIICFAGLIFCVSVILLNAVSGTGNTRMAMNIEFITTIIYLLYVIICVMLFRTDVEIVWLAEILYWFLIGIFSWWYLRSMKWKTIIV